jgi:hypothetical protein
VYGGAAARRANLVHIPFASTSFVWSRRIWIRQVDNSFFSYSTNYSTAKVHRH